MWTISTEGFTSAVQDKNDTTQLVIRARARGDLERLIKPLAPADRPRIIDNEGTDYPYRVRLPRAAYADLIRAQILGIDYGNFKDAVKARQGKHRAGVYGSIWGVLLRLERQHARRRRGGSAATDLGSLFDSTAAAELHELRGPETPSADELEEWFGRGDGAQ